MSQIELTRQFRKKKIIELLRKKYSIPSISRALHMDPQTIYDWKKLDKKFGKKIEEAIQIVDEKELIEVEKALVKSAKGYIVTAIEEKVTHEGDVVQCKIQKHIPASVLAQMFYLCNRNKNRWQNVNKMEVTGDKGGPIRFIIEDGKTDDTKPSTQE